MARIPEAGGTTTPAANSNYTFTSVEAGTAQNITASPATGYHFVNWAASPSGNATFGNRRPIAATYTVTLHGQREYWWYGQLRRQQLRL